MLFTSGEFLFVYLPLTLLLFFLIARYVGNAAAAAWLVLASFVFYAYWLPLYTGLLAASVVFNYTLGNRILACPVDRRRLRLGWLCFAVGVDLLVLGYFKYANFFLGTVAELSGRPLSSATVPRKKFAYLKYPRTSKSTPTAKHSHPRRSRRRSTGHAKIRFPSV